MFRRSKILSYTIVFLCCMPSVVSAQESFRVLFYNVENLFDCKNDSLKDDEEFLPEATRHWTFSRYREKLQHIAKAIIASGDDGRVPALVGLCEVENDSCLTDLVRRSPLREADYRYVMTDSPDRRGIDVALLYQRGSFKLLQHRSVRVPSEQVHRPPTRDILHAVGKVLSGDTLDVFVCHLPSRSGGSAQSERHRLLAARTLRQAADSVMRLRQQPHLILMGDFNDYPTSRSLKKVLCADSTLYNMMQHLKGGTYRYRAHWGIFDQIIVSADMLSGKGGIRTSPAKVQILRHPFLLEEDDKQGGDKPFRTYYGMKYNGGFSDHLPVCLDLEVLCPM